jgi:hypothetical protein
MKMLDAESGDEVYVDTSSSGVQNAHKEWWREQCSKRETVFAKSRVDSVSIRTDEDYVKSLIALFARRG